MMTPLRSHWMALALGVVLAACAPSQEVQTSPQPATADRADSSAIAKVGSARYPYIEADVHFMSAMIGHHSQAVLMAGWAPSHGANPAVRTLAERIVNGQQDEIATMQQWLRDRGKPIPDAGRTGKSDSLRSEPALSNAKGQAHSHHAIAMPGMLTEAQLRQLDQAKGDEFNRLFLTFMIQHHRGAVAMVEDLFGTPGAAREETVFKFANDVSVDQSTEVARMEKMLAALTPEASSP